MWKTTINSLFLLTASHLWAATEVSLPGGASLRHQGATISLANAEPSLAKGELLMTSANGLLGASRQTLRTNQFQLECKGSVLVSQLPGQPHSLTCLSGHTTVWLNANRSSFAEIRAGEIMLVTDGADKLPASTPVRLSKLLATHPLLQSPPNGKSLARAAEQQEQSIAKGKLILSGVQLKGGQAVVANVGSHNGSANSGQSGASGGASSSSGGGASGGGSSGGGGSASVASVGGGHASCGA